MGEQIFILKICVSEFRRPKGNSTILLVQNTRKERTVVARDPGLGYFRNWRVQKLVRKLRESARLLKAQPLRGLNLIRSTLHISSAFLWSEGDGVTGQNFEVQVAITCT